MDWLKRLFGKKLVLADGSKAKFDRSLGAVLRLRRGMWVAVKNSASPIGIVTALTNDGTARVMLVDGRGEDKIEVDVPASSLRQAARLEIPAPRRPRREVAERLGYKEKA
jgi:adenosine/AMP kinase